MLLSEKWLEIFRIFKFFNFFVIKDLKFLTFLMSFSWECESLVTKDLNSPTNSLSFIRTLIGCLGILYHPMLDEIRRLLARLGDHFQTSIFRHNNIYCNELYSTDKISNTINHRTWKSGKKMFSQVKSMVKVGKTGIRSTMSNIHPIFKFRQNWKHTQRS